MQVYLQLESIIHRRKQTPNLDWQQTPANSLRKEKLAKSLMHTVLGNSMRRPWCFVSKQTEHCEIATHILESFPKHAPPQRLLPASHNPCFHAIFVDGTNYPHVLWYIFPFSNREIAEKRVYDTSSKRVWLLVLADTYTSIFGLGVSPEVVNSQSTWICFQDFVFYVVSLWSWMFHVLLKSKFSSCSLWQGLGEAWSGSVLAIPSLCGASWANGWCRNCGWEQARSLLPPPHRGTWKGSEEEKIRRWTGASSQNQEIS